MSHSVWLCCSAYLSLSLVNFKRLKEESRCRGASESENIRHVSARTVRTTVIKKHGKRKKRIIFSSTTRWVRIPLWLTAGGHTRRLKRKRRFPRLLAARGANLSAFSITNQVLMILRPGGVGAGVRDEVQRLTEPY